MSEEMKTLTLGTTLYEVVDEAARASLNQKANDADLSKVAKSGAYNDLEGKPTIPSKVADLEDAGDYAKAATVGDLTYLVTNRRENLVNAINEVSQKLESQDVSSVNGKTGTVVLTASDVGAATEAALAAESTARAEVDTDLQSQIAAVRVAVGTPLTAATAAAMTDTTKIYVYVGSETGYTNGNWYYFDGSAWVAGGIYNSTAFQTDTTLSISGAAADAKATGDAIERAPDASSATAGQAPIADGAGGWAWGDVATSGDSVPTEVRQAIVTLFQNGVYTRDDMSDEVAVIQSWATEITAISVSPATLSLSGSTPSTITAVTSPAGGAVTWSSSNTSVATVSGGVVTGVSNGTCTITASCGGKSATCAVTISGFATLLSISAVYTQGGTVYSDDALDDLKDDLVVTANYDDGRSVPVTDYTLQGELAVGTSTIAVIYGGKTATFTVEVSDSLIMSATQGNITSGSTDADKVTIVLNTLSFDPSEVKTISVADGYQFFAFSNFGVTNISQAGTVHSNNQMNAYAVGSNGYVQNGAEINSRIAISSTNNWQTSKTYTNSSDSISMEITGIGIYIKTTDGSALSPEQAQTVFTIS